MEEQTKYKIETTDKREMQLMLQATKMACTLYDILCWRREIYNGKNYGEGSVIYRNKLYSKQQWELLKHDEDEYDENHYLKDKPIYCYTEDDVERKLNKLLEDVGDFIYDYME